MIKVMISGFGGPAIQKLVSSTSNGALEGVITSDIEAAHAVRTGQAQFMIGSCLTGAGGSVAAATAILGAEKVAIISMPGIPPDARKISNFVKEGKLAFGITYDHMDLAVPALVRSILEMSQG